MLPFAPARFSNNAAAVGGAAEPSYERTAFLSSTGNDGTAVLNDPDLPYLTADAALADLLFVYPAEVCTLRLLSNYAGAVTENQDLADLLVAGLVIRSHDATRRTMATLPLCGDLLSGSLDLRLVNVIITQATSFHASHTVESIGTITGDSTSEITTLDLEGSAVASNGDAGTTGVDQYGNSGTAGENAEFPGNGGDGDSVYAIGTNGTAGGNGDSAWSVSIVGESGFTIGSFYGYGRDGGTGGAGGDGGVAVAGDGGSGGNATGFTEANGGNGGNGGSANASGGDGGAGGNGGHGSIVTVTGFCTFGFTEISGGVAGAGGAGGGYGAATAGTGGEGGSGYGTGGVNGAAGNNGATTLNVGATGANGLEGNNGAII